MRLFPLIATMLAVMLNCEGAVAQPGQTSANDVMPGCRDVVLQINQIHLSGISKQDLYEMGFCMGTISGLSYVGKSYDICMPTGMTSQQATDVVVQYIDKRPERMNENFMLLAVEALQTAWPCQR